jgi:response regulator of citrate/malate metabolism
MAVTLARELCGFIWAALRTLECDHVIKPPQADRFECRLKLWFAHDEPLDQILLMD